MDITTVDMALRIGLATGLGLLLGFDREVQGKPAGIRTHGVVCAASAAITLSALLLFADVTASGGTADPLRVIQGLAQAIGFIAAGAIYVARGTLHNLTSAANVWLTTAIGIACGAGQFELALLTAAMGVFIVSLLRVVERFIPGSEKAKEE